MRTVVIVGLAGAVLALGACGLASAVNSGEQPDRLVLERDGRILLPTHGGGSDEPQSGAALPGVLRGDVGIDGGCVWIDTEASEPRVAILWPRGYSARFDPVRVYGPDGQLLARGGDRVTLGGGGDSRPMSRCGLDGAPVFTAHGFAEGRSS